MTIPLFMRKDPPGGDTGQAPSLVHLTLPRRFKRRGEPPRKEDREPHRPTLNLSTKLESLQRSLRGG